MILHASPQSDRLKPSTSILQMAEDPALLVKVRVLMLLYHDTAIHSSFLYIEAFFSINLDGQGP